MYHSQIANRGCLGGDLTPSGDETSDAVSGLTAEAIGLLNPFPDRLRCPPPATPRTVPRCGGCSSATCSCSSTGRSRSGRGSATCTSSASTCFSRSRRGRSIPNKRWLSNPQHAAYFGFALAVLACWLMSPFSEQGTADRRGLVQNRRLLLPVSHDDPRRGRAQAHRGRVSGRDGPLSTALVSRIPGRTAHVPHGHRPHDRRR